MMVRVLRRIVLAMVVLALAGTASQRTALAHGTQDQSLLNDPGCLATTLHASAPSTSPLRQEFVPALSGLTGIDICLTLASSSLVNVQIRSGTAASPGPVLSSASLSPMTGTRWVHVELQAPIATPPGVTHVIEVSGFPSFSWRGTCGQVAMPDCPAADADQYAAGVSSAGPAIGDFGFRTYDPGDTDLDGMPDGYELAHGCLDRTTADASGDPDADTATSGYEYGLGSDPCVAEVDTDGDGCTDFEESRPNPAFGGQRNPNLPSDFYDVNNSKKIDAADIGLVRSKFNTQLGGSGYDPRYDRAAGAHPWAPGPPDDKVNAVDIGLVRAEFNHSCIAPP